MRRIACIALNTYRELVRGKVLFSVLFFAIVLMIVSAMFGSVAIGDQVKIIKDFGLFTSSFFTVSFAVISGSALLYQELSKKTVFNILAKPVQRFEFIIGKYLGMLATAIVMLVMMAVGLMIFVSFFGLQHSFSLATGFYTIILQLVVICAAAILFSSIVVTPMLSGAFTFALFIAARSTEYLVTFMDDPRASSAVSGTARFFYYLLPHLDMIDVNDQVVYGAVISPQLLGVSTLYCLTYAGIMLALAIIFFERKEFK